MKVSLGRVYGAIEQRIGDIPSAEYAKVKRKDFRLIAAFPAYQLSESLPDIPANI